MAADVEILDTYRALAAYADANPVYLVTSDLNMRLRAHSSGIELRVMPPESFEPLGGDETSDNA
jgi:predicted ribonuclease YlaK